MEAVLRHARYHFAKRFMRIGVDGNEANVNQRVGVSVYTLSLLTEWHKQASSDLLFTIYLSANPLGHMPVQNEYFRYVVVKPAKLWSRIVLPAYLYFHRDIDVFFAPAHYSPTYLPAPLVVTVHDVAYHYFPKEFLKKDLYKLNVWTKQSLDKASKVIAVSRNTKDDIIKVYGTSSSKVTVVYNGFDTAVTSEKESKKSEKPYLLYVGTLQPRKNISFLISAFAEFKKTHEDYQLRIVGRKGWMYEDILKTAKKLKIEDDVIFEGFVPDTQKNVLYAKAVCFVMPSLYEGFNIPCLEALSLGCPVVAANVSSLPEVGGDACLYFDPADTASLLKKLETITSDKKLCASLISKGKQQVKKFSWQKSAQETLDVIIKSARK